MTESSSWAARASSALTGMATGRRTSMGSVSDASGLVRGGHFNPGENPIYNNLDFLLEELTDVELIRAHDAQTDTIEMEVRQADTDGPQA